MPHGSTLYNTWSTEASRDRAWFLLRKTLEEAERKYDLHLDGAVDIDQGNAQFMITFRNDNLKMGYFVSFFDIAHSRPNYLLENSAYPTLRDFVDALNKQQAEKNMGIFQWDRDPVDVAWYILRRIIEMADKRSDFNLTGRLSVVQDARILFTFEVYGYKSSFYMTEEVLTEGMVNPADIAQEYGDKICRDFQRHLKEDADRVLSEIQRVMEQEKQRRALAKRPRNTNQEYFRIGRQVRKIDEAGDLADKSKRAFVIRKVWPRTRYITFAGSKILAEPLKKYGTVLPDYVCGTEYDWSFHVDARYDFDLVLGILQAIEAADDCVQEYLRALWSD